MSGGPFTQSEIRARVVDFPHPLFEDFTSILIQKPASPNPTWSVFKPFSWRVWISVVAALFFSSGVSWLFSRFSPFSGWNLKLDFAISEEVSINEHLWNVTGSLLQQGKYYLITREYFYEEFTPSTACDKIVKGASVVFFCIRFWMKIVYSCIRSKRNNENADILNVPRIGITVSIYSCYLYGHVFFSFLGKWIIVCSFWRVNKFICGLYNFISKYLLCKLIRTHLKRI